MTETQDEVGVRPLARVRFDKWPNLGRAPVFWLELHADGRADYEPQSNCDLQGSFAGTMVPGQWDALQRRIAQGGFDTMKPRYASHATCRSTEFLEIEYIDGQRLVIENYGDAAPDAFRQVRAYLGKIITVVRWDRIADRSPPTENDLLRARMSAPCECGSGKRHENCCGLIL
jgi:Domain of unknown function (DUF6438)